MTGGSTPTAGPGSTVALRLGNRRRLLDAVRTSDQPTQAELARVTGLAPSTVSSLVREMQQAGLVDVVERRRGGRAAHAVRLSRRAGLVAAVDIGHRHMTVAVADLNSEILAETRVDLPIGHTAPDGVTRAAEMTTALLAGLGTERTALACVGLGLPAPIDVRTGMVGAPSILPGWVGRHVSSLAERAFGLPAFVENDANLGAIAEQTWGAGRGRTSMAYLKIADGVGAGLILAGRLYRGPAGTAGEIGHTTMHEFGPVCRCGNRGCLETMVSTEAVLNLLRPTLGADLTLAQVVERAGGGSAACRRVLSDTGHHVGVAVANLCNVVNPEVIVVGGELATAGPLLLAPMLATLTRYGIPSAVDGVGIVTAELGARAHLLGAANLAAREAAVLS